MKVAISQSNYIPWRGYFDLINKVDTFILFDSVQYTKRDWRNRNKIKTSNGTLWLSVPVINDSFHQPINETKILKEDKVWYKNHLKTIQMNYAKAQYFSEVFPFLEEIYEEINDKVLLTDVNEHLLKSICNYLGIKTEIKRDTDFEIEEGKNEKLLNICKQLNAKEYISGPAAKSYIDESFFETSGVKVSWMDYSGYVEYPQLYNDFEPAVSIIDLLLNTGKNALNYISK